MVGNSTVLKNDDLLLCVGCCCWRVPGESVEEQPFMGSLNIFVGVARL